MAALSLVAALLATLGVVAAAEPRCERGQACPSDAELIQALYSQDGEAGSEIIAEADARGEIVLVHPRRARGVSNVLCGSMTDGGTMVCRFDARYAERQRRIVALRLSRGKTGWVGDMALSFWR